MTPYELYFRDECFKGIVDRYVAKHMTTYIGAFNSIYIKEAYERRLCHTNLKDERRKRYERI